MNIMKSMFRAITIALCALLTMPNRAEAVDFIDYGPATDLIETDVHFLIGGSAILQNYSGCFSEIRELNASMGTAYGVGAGAVFGLRKYLGLGTEFNITVNNNRINMAVTNDDVTSVSNIFLRNRYYYMNIPLYLSFRFGLASTIVWNVDTGLYYSYGFAGSQKQTIYNSTVNDLGQLVPRVLESKPGYFNNGGTFVNRFRRGDIGLHLATAVTFGRRISVGGRVQIGLKNISHTTGLKNPNIHNINVMATLGYKF